MARWREELRPVTDRYLDDLARTFPNARVVELRAGHAPQLETPDELEAEVETFLASLPG